ncbi:unnamed protein product [Ceutorhynchus assimilis]|uniref:Uncharacterized protein n=1 Tax=Ceutorhynchus assimilis TaxID=467358 RepID=A0A9N9QN60_9CUCU|nr:unnamed protein product [Ceutorhynchus assimilis]
MIQDEEELDYEIEVEDEDRLLESSDQESEKCSSDEDSAPRTTCQTPSNNDRKKINYLRCYRTYANSSRRNYRYSERNTNCSTITDGSYEEDEVNESNNCLTSIDSGVSDPDVSQFTFDENKEDKDYPESPTKHLNYNNNKKPMDFSYEDTVMNSINTTATICNEKNINEDFLKNSHPNNMAIHSPKSSQKQIKKKNIFGNITIQIPTKPKSTNFTRNLILSNNTVTSPNLFQSSENVQTPIKITPISKVTTNKLPDRSPSKKVQEPIISKNKRTSTSQSDGSANSYVDAMAIQSSTNAQEPIKSLNNREIAQSKTGIAKKPTTETAQSLGNLQGPSKPKIIPNNFKVQIIGQERSLVPQPQLSTLDPPQFSRRIAKKPFTWKRTFEKPTILVNSKDISRFIASCTTDDDNNCLKSPNIFKIPLKKPPFKPEWQTVSAPVEIPDSKDDDMFDLTRFFMKSSIASDGDDIADPSFLDNDGMSFYEDDPEKLEMVNEWVSKQPSRIIPSVYRGLCYKTFFNTRRCIKCRNQHNLRVHFANKSNLTKQEIQVGLSFAIEYPSFYEQVLPIFAEIFSSEDDKEGLVYMIHQIFKNNPPINQVNALNTVLINLQQTDLETLQESIQYVLIQVGFRSYISFGEALVEVIISSDNVPSCWPIIRIMITGGLTLPGKLASNFLTKLIKPPIDSKLCREVYTLILKYKFVDITSINSELRDQFFLLAKPQNRVHCEENRRNNVPSTSYPSAFPQQVHFNGPSYNSAPHIQNSSATPEKMLGSNSNENIDFGTLWGTKRLSFKDPYINEDEVFEQFGHDYRDPSKIPNQSKSRMNERPSNFYRASSTGDDSLPSRENLPTKTSGNTFPNRSGFAYNPEGVQYDPMKDYDYSQSKSKPTHQQPQSRDSEYDRLLNNNPEHAHTTQRKYKQPQTQDRLLNNNSEPAHKTKRKHQQPQPQDTEFDRLLNNNSEPPRKKFQLNSGRVVSGPQIDDTFDESFTGIPAARPRQELQYSKPPDEPVFGKLCLNPDYTHNTSLHNLYVESLGGLDMNLDDLALLDEIFVMGKGHDFLKLIEKYKGSKNVRYFITGALAHLKCCNQTMVKVWKRILDGMSRAMPNFYGSSQIRAIIEVITMNILFMQVTCKLWSEAKDLLMIFTDWDSLVTSRLTLMNPQTKLSILGKYLFIAKLLQFTEPKYSYKILTCPELKLMEHESTWPYCEDQCTTRELRNRNFLLNTFLQETYLQDIEVVIDIYKVAFSRNGGISNFNVIPYINPMLERLIAEKNISALEHINKSNVFFEYMDINILKQFLLLMFSHLPMKDGCKIFDICTSRSIYKRICINDILQENILLYTTNTTEEIEIILKYCFYKLVQIRYLPSGFRFWIKTNTISGTDEEMVNDAITTTKNKVVNMLDKFFKIRGRTTTGHDVVEVAKDDLILFLERS